MVLVWFKGVDEGAVEGVVEVGVFGVSVVVGVVIVVSSVCSVVVVGVMVVRDGLVRVVVWVKVELGLVVIDISLLHGPVAQPLLSMILK